LGIIEGLAIGLRAILGYPIVRIVIKI